jgi:hypothetical protein
MYYRTGQYDRPSLAAHSADVHVLDWTRNRKNPPRSGYLQYSRFVAPLEDTEDNKRQHRTSDKRMRINLGTTDLRPEYVAKSHTNRTLDLLASQRLYVCPTIEILEEPQTRFRPRRAQTDHDAGNEEVSAKRGGNEELGRFSTANH